MTLISRAWMLDPVEFHLELDALRRSPDGLLAVRDAAVRIWEDPGPVARPFLEVLALGDPEEWRTAPDVAHLVDWYRLLMAPHLLPMRSFADPDTLRRRLPDLGWPPMEARRLARGRELLCLAREHGSPELADELSLHMRAGTKGWLHHDDVLLALDRLRHLDRELFRRHRDMVPVVEDAFEVLEAAATKPDHVLVVLTAIPLDHRSRAIGARDLGSRLPLSAVR